MPEWDSAQYLRFEAERTQPARDLAARVGLSDPARVIDLGCGPGNSTEVIAARFTGAAITGLDSSPEMIGKARAKHPEWNWIAADITEWAAGRDGYDLIFSNAALQWVGNHHELFPRLLTHCRALAVQVPGNWDALAHRLMREAAGRMGFLDRVREWHTHPESVYYDILAPHARHVDLWVTEYMHILADRDAIVEWYRGSGLRPFLQALDSDDAREAFLSEYREAIRREFPARPDGRVLFPFRRIFFVAYTE